MSRMYLYNEHTEVAFGQVLALCGGRIARVELFEPDNQPGMRARFHAPLAAKKPNPIGKLYARHVEAFNRRDWPEMTSVFSDDFVLVDKRPATGWPILRGPAEMEAMWARNTLTIWPDAQHFFEFVEGDDETAILYYGGRGHANQELGGGELEDLGGSVAVMREGLLCYMELFNTDALEAMRVRRTKLRPIARRRSNSGLPLEPLVAEHAVLRLTDAIQARDWSAVEELLDPRLVPLDHRPGSPIRDRDGLLAHLQALSDTACRYQVRAATDRASAGVLTVGGQPMGAVMLWHADRCTRLELLDRDDAPGARASFERLAEPRGELAIPRPVLATEAQRRLTEYNDAVNRRDCGPFFRCLPDGRSAEASDLGSCH
jgi:ketosteroid isomerase-like protein